MDGKANLTVKSAISLFLVVLVTSATAGKIIYVDANATGANEGSSWANAYDYLQDALTDANSAEKPIEIRVARGTYRPDRRKADPAGTGVRWEAFRLINRVSLKGGYVGVGAPDPNARDITRCETILSGDLNGDDLPVVRAADMRGDASRDDNSFTVVADWVSGEDLDETAVLDGFTITGGNITFMCSGPCGGGGLLCGLHDRPTIKNCTFTANSADGNLGGAIFRGAPTLINCIFKNNLALAGSALSYCDGPIRNCLFVGNLACGGGVLFACYGEITNCTFVRNLSKEGRALFFWSAPSRPVRLANSILRDGGHEIFIKDESAVDVVFSNVQGGWPGKGNIDAEPCFAEPGYWDPNGTPQDPNDDFWVDGDYHLKSQAGRWDRMTQSRVKDDVTSPCIDAGDPSSPIGDEPFPNGGIINMGAYGGTAEASRSYFGEPVCETIVAGDINGDCRVDFADFAIMALHWLEDNSG